MQNKNNLFNSSDYTHILGCATVVAITLTGSGSLVAAADDNWVLTPGHLSTIGDVPEREPYQPIDIGSLDPRDSWAYDAIRAREAAQNSSSESRAPTLEESPEDVTGGAISPSGSSKERFTLSALEAGRGISSEGAKASSMIFLFSNVDIAFEGVSSQTASLENLPQPEYLLAARDSISKSIGDILKRLADHDRLGLTGNRDSTLGQISSMGSSGEERLAINELATPVPEPSAGIWSSAAILATLYRGTKRREDSAKRLVTRSTQVDASLGRH